MTPVVIDAPAKLNLFLRVTGKRADGYHLLESLVAFTQFGDRLEILPADTLTLRTVGPFADALSETADNLVIKAAAMLRLRMGSHKGAHMVLHKMIPVGAGLGGGSADAAAALLVLNKFWRLYADPSILADLALKLGSDVPVCLQRQTAYLRGVGEKVTPLQAPLPYWFLLVNPGEPVLTSAVFHRFGQTFDAPLSLPDSFKTDGDALEFICKQHNSLQPAAIACVPSIMQVLEMIGNTKGCKISRMSGSGATCFGLYASQPDAQAARQTIHNLYPGWWSVVTPLFSQDWPAYGKAQ